MKLSTKIINPNKLNYNETPNSGVPSDSYRDLAMNVNKKMAYDAGVGIHYQATEHLNTSLEYLYYYAGHLSSSAQLTGGSAEASAAPANFLVRSQNLLFAVNWRF